MTEAADNPAPIGTAGLTSSAGALIRAAREQRGLHIAALAAAIKVPQRKLEALEADRYDELLDMTFTRALAQTVCRSLKIDAQPVLDLLPQAPGTAPKLQHVSNGLNAPFRDKSGGDDGMDWSWLRRPVFWGTLLVLAAAAAVAFMPERFFGVLRGAGAGAAAPTAAAPAIAAPAAEPAIAAPAPAVAPALPAASAVAASPATDSGVTALGAPSTVEAQAPTVAPPGAVKPAAGALLAVKVASESWVEVQDAKGQTLLSRKVAAGESLGLEGEVPLRVTIGNAAGTQLTFRGQLVDLSSNTVANVARLQLN
jgi:cytoskeleton protein RodZ